MHLNATKQKKLIVCQFVKYKKYPADNEPNACEEKIKKSLNPWVLNFSSFSYFSYDTTSKLVPVTKVNILNSDYNLQIYQNHFYLLFPIN